MNTYYREYCEELKELRKYDGGNEKERQELEAQEAVARQKDKKNAKVDGMSTKSQ